VGFLAWYDKQVTADNMKFWSVLLHKNTLIGAGLFTVSSALFGLLHWSPYLVDADAFYHAKMAELIWQHGLSVSFTWLPFTQLQDTFANQHILYHLLVAPLTVLVEPWQAVKISGTILSGACVTYVYFFLKKHRVPYALLYVLILLMSQPFLFRISLGKALPLTLLLLLVTIDAWWSRKYAQAFVAAFLLTWTHGAWVLILPLYISYILFFAGRKWLSGRSFTNLRLLKVCAGTLIAIILGLLFHPDFPQNILFYVNQIWHIGLINYQSRIGVGGEWYPYAIDRLVADLELVVFFLIITLGAVSVYYRKLSVRTWWLGFWFTVFLGFTLKSRRYVDILSLFSILFIAFAHKDIGLTDFVLKQGRRLRSQLTTLRASLLVGVIGFFVVSWGGIGVANYTGAYRDLRATDRTAGLYAQAASYVTQHTRPGSIVFHSDWDEFPHLFYHAADNRFIAGLDPTFFYNKYRDLYWVWVGITTGKARQGFTRVITEEFHSQTVFIDSTHQAMRENFLRAPSWQLVYQDSEAAIFILNKDQ
jgi:hypothetical protein